MSSNLESFLQALKRVIKASGMYLCLVPFAFSDVILHAVLKDQNLFLEKTAVMVVCKGYILFFCIVILANIMLEAFFDRHLWKLIDNRALITGISCLLIILGIFFLINLQVNNNQKPYIELWNIQRFFLGLTFLFAIFSRALFMKLRTRIDYIKV